MDERIPRHNNDDDDDRNDDSNNSNNNNNNNNNIGNLLNHPDRHFHKSNHPPPGGTSGSGKSRRLYACPYQNCDKAFAKNYNLKAHVRLHTGEHPFQCPYQGCLKTFKWKSSLRSHKLAHANADLSRGDGGGTGKAPEASASGGMGGIGTIGLITPSTSVMEGAKMANNVSKMPKTMVQIQQQQQQQHHHHHQLLQQQQSEAIASATAAAAAAAASVAVNTTAAGGMDGSVLVTNAKSPPMNTVKKGPKSKIKKDSELLQQASPDHNIQATADQQQKQLQFQQQFQQQFPQHIPQPFLSNMQQFQPTGLQMFPNQVTANDSQSNDQGFLIPGYLLQSSNPQKQQQQQQQQQQRENQQQSQQNQQIQNPSQFYQMPQENQHIHLDQQQQQQPQSQFQIIQGPNGAFFMVPTTNPYLSQYQHCNLQQQLHQFQQFQMQQQFQNPIQTFQQHQQASPQNLQSWDQPPPSQKGSIDILDAPDEVASSQPNKKKQKTTHKRNHQTGAKNQDEKTKQSQDDDDLLASHNGSLPKYEPKQEQDLLTGKNKLQLKNSFELDLRNASNVVEDHMVAVGGDPRFLYSPGLLTNAVGLYSPFTQTQNKPQTPMNFIGSYPSAFGPPILSTMNHFGIGTMSQSLAEKKNKSDSDSTTPAPVQKGKKN